MLQLPSENAPPPATGRAAHPLGPLWTRERLAHPLLGRLIALALAAACVALLGAAARVQPSPTGVGTHTRLGLPPCGFMQLTGLPCPNCGMTTAFAHTVRGHWPAALRAQAMGFLLALMTGVTAVGCAVVALTGRTWVINWYRVPPGRALLVICLMFLAAWAVKIVQTLAPRGLP